MGMAQRPATGCLGDVEPRALSTGHQEHKPSPLLRLWQRFSGRKSRSTETHSPPPHKPWKEVPEFTDLTWSSFSFTLANFNLHELFILTYSSSDQNCPFNSSSLYLSFGLWNIFIKAKLKLLKCSKELIFTFFNVTHIFFNWKFELGAIKVLHQVI